MIIPDFLRPESKIRIVSPSGAIDPDFVISTANFLTDKGFAVELGASVFARKGRFAGSDEQRIADLQQALDDPDTDLVICSRGGYGLVRIIDKIGFDGIKAHPKWVAGFSDITVLHNALHKNGIASLHSIMCRHISNQGEACQKFLSTLAGELPAYVCSAEPVNVEGRASGRLVGGNLSLLYALQGTAFDLDYEGKILFIEDLCEPMYHIDRMLQSLRLAGVFDKIAALVVGQFTKISDDDSFDGGVQGIISELVKGKDYPVLYGFPAGHVDANFPLLLGAETTLDVSRQKAVLQQFAR